MSEPTTSPLPYRLRQPHSPYVDEQAANLIERLEHENASLRAMQTAMRTVNADVPRETLELMVRLAYEMECFSGGRCAEILGESVQKFMERGWVQSRIRDVLYVAAEVTAGRPVCEVINQILKDYE